jgi:drug/metabolite transporter (DMT)-like permease
MLGRILFILIPVTAAAVGQMILKIGMGQVGEIKLTENLWGSIVKMATNPYVVGGLAFFGVNAFLWLVVLSKEKLSFAYPLVAFAYVVTILLAKYVLHEDIPALRWAGLATIIVGILMIAKSSA